jgi:hypothetical protein
MDVNIAAIKAAGGNDWEKVQRYYVNLAPWLNPPGYNTSCLYLSAFTSHFSHVGFQEYSRKLRDIELGGALRDHLAASYGPCWVRQFVFDALDFLKVRVIDDPRLPIPPNPCLTCPPFELIELAALGGLVRASFDEAAQIHAAVR